MIAKRFQKGLRTKTFFLAVSAVCAHDESQYKQSVFAKKNGFLFKVRIALTFAPQKPIMLL